MTTLWIIWVLQAAICAHNQWAYRRRLKKQDAALSSVTPDQQKPAVVIVPIKGRNADTEDFFNSLRSQRYADYRIIYTLESNSDPAVVTLREQLGLEESENSYTPQESSDADSPGLSEIQIVIAGAATECGQKVHNQLAAFKELHDSDELVVFADADLHASRDWLARLTAPLNHGSDQVCTGYRWLIPESPSLANQLAAIINSTAVTAGGHSSFQLLWGGSIAVTHEAFKKMNVPSYLEGSLNDDLQISRAARRADLTLTFIHSLQLPSPIWFTWPSMIEFARRQYYQVSRYTPKIYGLALISLGLNTAGWLTALGALCFGHTIALVPIVIVTIFDQIRAFGRTRLRRILIPEPHLTRLHGTAILEHIATPLWSIFHFALAASALFMKSITWAGITYSVQGRQKITVIRPDAPDDPPS
ncbi:MAG: glycosyltransferase family 2 protein [Verrucomicrobiota bacterium]